jgi:hypothetical protein
MRWLTGERNIKNNAFIEFMFVVLRDELMVVKKSVGKGVVKFAVVPK